MNLGRELSRRRRKMNAGASHIKHQLIKRLECPPVSVSFTRIFATAMLLAAGPLLVAAQDSKSPGEEPAKSAVHGFVARVDLQTQSTPLVGISVQLTGDSLR